MHRMKMKLTLYFGLSEYLQETFLGSTEREQNVRKYHQLQKNDVGLEILQSEPFVEKSASIQTRIASEKFKNAYDLKAPLLIGW